MQDNIYRQMSEAEGQHWWLVERRWIIKKVLRKFPCIGDLKY
jgi:hypothetical protein